MSLHSFPRFCAALLVLLVPALPASAQTYFLWTGQAAAQTQIDVNHTSSWYLNVGSGSVSFGGGRFTMKRGASATTTVTLTLYAGGPGGTLLASRTVDATAFTGQFGVVDFSFASVQTLGPGSYYASLTSTAPDVQSQAFFIKGVNDAVVSLDGTTGTLAPNVTVSSAPSGANLTLVKSGAATVTTGGTLVYTFAIGNDGGSASGTSARVADQLPSGVVATAVAPGAGVSAVNCGTLPSSTGALLSCAVTLSAAVPASTAGAASFTLTTSAPAAPGTITNYASVDPTGGTSPATPGTGCTTSSCSSATTSVTGPDLAIAKTHAGDFTQGQSGATYTLAVSNVGNGPTSGTVTVADTVPAGLTPTAAVGTGWTCGITGQSVSCTRADALAGGGAYPAITLTVDVAANAADVTNTATVSGGGDTNAANNSSADATTVIATGPDLTIAKSHTGDFTRGQVGATYTLVVSNSGASATTGTVTVSDTVPAGLTPTAAAGTGWSCGLAGQTMTCTRADALASGQSYPAITLTVDVDAGATSVTNTASVSGGGDVDTSDNTASDPTTVVGGPNLAIAKSHAADFVQGQTGATYTLTISNVGDSPTTGLVTVSDTVPAGLTPTAASGTGWSCGIAGQTMTCTRADALSPATAYPAITLTVDVSASATNVVNTASVAGGGDVDGSDNTTSDPTTVLQSGADLTVAVTGPATAQAGQASVAYTAVVANIGLGSSSGSVTVQMTLPGSLTPVPGSGDGWTCSTSGQVLSCTRSESLQHDRSYPAVTFGGALDVAATGQLTVHATVTGGNDVEPGNNSGQAQTDVTPPPFDLAVSLTHTGDFAQGQTPAYSYAHVSNVGGLPATGDVTLSIALPAGLEAFAAGGAGWNCVTSASTVLCTRADALGAGASYPLVSIAAAVAADAAPSLTSTAEVVIAGDGVPGNNTAADVANVRPMRNEADLAVAVVGPPTLSPGVESVFRFVVRNLGPRAATGAIVTLGLSPALDIRAASVPRGTFDRPTGQWHIGDLAVGEQLELAFTAVVAEVDRVTLNAWRTAGNPVDPNVANNTAVYTGLVPNADVGLSVHASTTTPLVGQAITIEVLARNAGPQATDVETIRLTIPAGLTLTGGVPSIGAYDQASARWVVPSLAPGAEAVLLLSGMTTTTGAQQVGAYRGPSLTPDRNPANDSASRVLNGLALDVAVVQTVDNALPLLGDTVRLRTTATNNGPERATGVGLRLYLPEGLVVESAAPSQGVFDPSSAVWMVGDLDTTGPSATAALDVVARVHTPQPLRVTAALDAVDQADEVAANNLSGVDLAINLWSTFLTDLVLDATASATAVLPGDAVTYRLAAVNRGPTFATNLTVSGSLPPGTTFVSASPSGGGQCSAPAPGAGGSVSCVWPGVTVLGDDARRTVDVTVRVSPGVAPGTTLATDFTVTSETGEYYPPSNTASPRVMVGDGQVTDLFVSAVMQSGDVVGDRLPVRVGTPTPMRFTVRNLGAVPVVARYEVWFDDETALRVAGASASQGLLAATSSSRGTWNTGLIPAGGEARVDLTMVMTSVGATSLHMRLIESSLADVNGQNDRATLVIDGYGAPGTGGRWVAAGNVDGAGGSEIIVGAGVGETPMVQVFRGDGTDSGIRFLAFDRRFIGGVRLAACDVDNDGVDEIIAGSGPHGGPHVRVLRVRGTAVSEMLGFHAFEREFPGGVYVGCGDVNGDNRRDIIVGAGEGRAPEVRVFTVSEHRPVLLASFLAYEPEFRGGVRPAGASFDGSGGAATAFRVITVPGAGRPVDVRGWSIADGGATLRRELRVVAPSVYQGGAFVRASDFNGDGQLDFVVGADVGVPSSVAVFTIETGAMIAGGQVYPSSFLGGVRFGVGVLDGGPGVPEFIAAPGPGGEPRIQTFSIGPDGRVVRRLNFLAPEVP